jgi:hypothetical protein
MLLADLYIYLVFIDSKLHSPPPRPKKALNKPDPVRCGRANKEAGELVQFLTELLIFSSRYPAVQHMG